MIRQFTWAVRRELWESRWLYLAPLSIAAVVVVGFAVYAARLPGQMAALSSLSPASQRNIIVEPYGAAAGLMMIAGLVVSFIYCVDALYGERRDRSVLLWKSLPVSDAMTVAAKLFIPVVAVQIVVWMTTVAAQFAMLLITTVYLKTAGQNAGVVWSQVHFATSSATQLYHLVALHGLFAAPLYAWVLLMSARAPRAPLMWALVPPLAVVFLERVALGSTRFADLIVSRLGGGMNAVPETAGTTLMDAMAMPPFAQFFGAPALWGGLAVAAVFVTGMIWLRRAAYPA